MTLGFGPQLAKTLLWANRLHQGAEAPESDGTLAILLRRPGSIPGRPSGAVVDLGGSTFVVELQHQQMLGLRPQPDAVSLRGLDLHQGAIGRFGMMHRSRVGERLDAVEVCCQHHPEAADEVDVQGELAARKELLEPTHLRAELANQAWNLVGRAHWLWSLLRGFPLTGYTCGMSPSRNQLRQSVLELPAEERWELAESIWESLEHEQTLPLPDWQRTVLEQRIAEDDASPEGGSPWPEVKKRILASL